MNGISSPIVEHPSPLIKGWMHPLKFGITMREWKKFLEWGRAKQKWGILLQWEVLMVLK